MLSMGSLSLLVSLLLYVCLYTIAILIIKGSLNNMKYTSMIDFLFNLVNVNLFIGIVLYGIGFIAWLYLLSKVNLNIAYPIAVTLSFLTITISSVLILKENITVNILAGMLFCLIGIIIIIMK